MTEDTWYAKPGCQGATAGRAAGLQGDPGEGPGRPARSTRAPGKWPTESLSGLAPLKTTRPQKPPASRPKQINTKCKRHRLVAHVWRGLHSADFWELLRARGQRRKPAKCKLAASAQGGASRTTNCDNGESAGIIFFARFTLSVPLVSQHSRRSLRR